MKSNGKGGDPKKSRKKNFKRRGKENNPQQPARGAQHGESSKSRGKKAVDFSAAGDGKFARKRVSSVDRPKWSPPQPPALDLVPALCIRCEKPIKEFSTALLDPETGQSLHFDCAISQIAEKEKLEKGDTVGYIGGGRFGIINFGNSQDTRKFRIKKIFEWENKETRSEWRVALCEHFSVT
ncbi:MAG: hypothetical protein FWD88_05455 [Treponema sp.]|nr:hypothetical protein [Treponema sp.]